MSGLVLAVVPMNPVIPPTTVHRDRKLRVKVNEYGGGNWGVTVPSLCGQLLFVQ